MGKAVKEVTRMALPEMIPGELGELLAEIEREAAPERLLELAVRLQTALQLSRVAIAPEQPALVES